MCLRNIYKYTNFPLWIVIAIVLSGCSSKIDPEASLASAQQAFKNKNFAVMEIELKNVLREDPENAEARLLLANAHLEFARGTAAEAQLDKAQALGIPEERLVVQYLRAWMYQKNYQEVINSENNGGIAANLQAADKSAQAEVQAIIGIAQLATGKSGVAKEKFNGALELHDANGIALVGAAQLAFKEKNVREGHEFLAAALDKQPEYGPGWSLAGDIYTYENKLEEAADAYGEAIKLRAVNVDDRLALALVELSRENFAAVSEQIKALTKGGYRIPHGAYVSGILSMIQGKIGLAKDHFEEVVSKRPNYMKAVCYLGLTLAATESLERAETNLERCVKAYPGAGFTRRAYALVLAAGGDVENARQQLSYLTNSETPDLQANLLLANIELNADNPGRAIVLLRKVIENDTTNAHAHLQLGVALISSGQEMEARHAFQTAFEVEPKLEDIDLLEARSLLKANKIFEATQRLKEIVKERPEDVRALNMLAICHGRLKEDKELERLLQQALKIDPSYNIAAVNLAKNYIENSRLQEATRLLEGVVKRDPDDLRALGMLLSVDLKENRSADANSRMQKAMERGDESAEKLLLKARFERSFQNFDAAESSLNRLISKYGYQSEWMTLLGNTQYDAGHFEKSVTTFNEIVNAEPENVAILLRLARSLDKTGQVKQAEGSVDTALKLSPNHPLAALTKIRYLIRRREATDARQRFDNLANTAPNMSIPELQTVESVLLMLEGKTAEAQNVASKVYQAEPNAKRAVQLARIYASSGRVEDAIDVLDQRLKQFPGERTVRFVLADAYAKSGQVDAAKEQYDFLLKQIPNDPVVFNNLANLLMKSDPDKALSLIQKALSIAPGTPALLDTLSAVLYEQGDYVGSEDAAKQAVSGEPNSSVFQFSLIRARAKRGEYDGAEEILAKIDKDDLDSEQRKEFLKLEKTFMQN